MLNKVILLASTSLTPAAPPLVAFVGANASNAATSHVYDFSSANSGDRLVIMAGTTQNGTMFAPPTGFTLQFSHVQAVSSFYLGGVVFEKVATGSETNVTLTPTGASPTLNAICSAAVILRNGGAFDKASYGIQPSAATSVTSNIGGASAQANSLLLGYAIFRDDDTDGLGSFSDSMSVTDETEWNGGGNFSITGYFGSQEVATQANHSRTWSTTAPGDEIMMILAAWNKL